MKNSANFEALGRQIATGQYISRKICLAALCLGILIGAMGMYILMPSDAGQHQTAQGGYKVPLDSAVEQQNTQQQDQHNRAILELESRLAVTPNDAKSWISLGNLYYDTGNHSKSVEAYEKALALDPSNPDVWVDCGVMYRAHGEFAKALEYFKKALEINEKHEFALFNSGVVLHNDLKNDTEAYAVWEKLATINPQFKTPNGQLLTTILKEHYNAGQ